MLRPPGWSSPTPSSIPLSLQRLQLPCTLARGVSRLCPIPSYCNVPSPGQSLHHSAGRLPQGIPRTKPDTDPRRRPSDDYWGGRSTLLTALVLGENQCPIDHGNIEVLGPPHRRVIHLAGGTQPLRRLQHGEDPGQIHLLQARGLLARASRGCPACGSEVLPISPP